ncbi:putative reverse transcriptase domain-containing protein [Tanacetum coccineum]
MIDLSYTNWTRHGEKDEPSISAPEPVNVTTEFVDDTDFALDIPTDSPATVEMVNATKDNFDEDDLVKWKVDNKIHKVYENIPAKRITDGVVRHPVDSQAWRTMDDKFPKTVEDPRNLRLGISADGVDINTRNRHHNDTREMISMFLDRSEESTIPNTRQNVAESQVGSLLHVPGKMKDGVNAGLDMVELGVKPELFVMQEEDKTTLPLA